MIAQEKSVLAAQPFLRGLPDQHLDTLAALCGHVAVPSGTAAVRRGRESTGLDLTPFCNSHP